MHLRSADCQVCVTGLDIVTPPIPNIRPWPVTRSRELAHLRIFDLRADIRVSPRTGQEHEVYVLKCPDWVNVVAITPDQQLICVEQFRHGSNTAELEIPGGVIDPQDLSPLEAGLRELREETGYAGEKARIISRIFPNPAIMDNTCHTVLVENCRVQHQLHLDDGEDLVTRLVPVREIRDLLLSGKIKHSLVIVALSKYLLMQQ